jgi:hypothetical protein
MAKALPCGTPGCVEIAELRDGKPYLIGQPPTRWPLRVHCSRCKKPSYLSARDYHRLPEVTTQQLEAWGLLDSHLRSLMGDGHPREHAIDLLSQGWSPAELAEVTPLPVPAPSSSDSSE